MCCIQNISNISSWSCRGVSFISRIFSLRYDWSSIIILLAWKDYFDGFDRESPLRSCQTLVWELQVIHYIHFSRLCYFQTGYFVPSDERRVLNGFWTCKFFRNSNSSFSVDHQLKASDRTTISQTWHPYNLGKSQIFQYLQLFGLDQRFWGDRAMDPAATLTAMTLDTQQKDFEKYKVNAEDTKQLLC